MLHMHLANLFSHDLHDLSGLHYRIESALAYYFASHSDNPSSIYEPYLHSQQYSEKLKGAKDSWCHTLLKQIYSTVVCRSTQNKAGLVVVTGCFWAFLVLGFSPMDHLLHYSTLTTPEADSLENDLAYLMEEIIGNQTR